MKRPWLVIALVLVLGAAFCVQATSTWKLGERQNLENIALPALVVLLEVGSITAAAIFFRARSRGLRVRAILMLILTAGLGGTGGVIAYGVVVGVVVATLMVGLVEVVGAYRHETAEKVVDQTEPVQQDNRDNQDNHEWSGPETVELPRLPDTIPTEVTSPAKLEAVSWSDEAIVADLRERGRTDPDQRGLQRHIRDTYSVGPAKATRVIDELRRIGIEVAS